MHEMSTDICPCLTASLFSKQKELLKCKTFFRSFSEENGDKNDCSGHPDNTDNDTVVTPTSPGYSEGQTKSWAEEGSIAVTKQAE